MAVKKVRWTENEINILIDDYKKGIPINQITKKLGRNYHSIATKAKRLGLKHLYFISTFQPIPTPEFAYCLGAWFGDRKSKKHLSLLVKDYDFITSFVEALNKFLKINTNIGKVRDLYYVQRQDKKFTEWITQNDLQYIIAFITSGGEKVISNFIKGFFDAEGTVRAKYTQVVQKTRDILDYTKVLLKQIGIDSSIWYERNRNTGYHVLRVSNILSLIRFYNKIGFNIKRKQERLKNVIQNKLLSKYFIKTLEYFKFLQMKQENKLSLYKISKNLSVSTAATYLWAIGIKPKLIQKGLTEKDLLDFNNKL